ncbi:hypothetical protein X925_05920 [Petrotoga sp. 9T1HF07.CasAA.8.2]|nr:hypothetical protein X925_05920 [Petrotoga sp. 9T1HF07.CasAA.8.2]
MDEREKNLFLTGGERGKGAIKLIKQESDNKIAHLQIWYNYVIQNKDKGARWIRIHSDGTQKLH